MNEIHILRALVVLLYGLGLISTAFKIAFAGKFRPSARAAPTGLKLVAIVLWPIYIAALVFEIARHAIADLRGNPR